MNDTLDLLYSYCRKDSLTQYSYIILKIRQEKEANIRLQ